MHFSRAGLVACLLLSLTPAGAAPAKPKPDVALMKKCVAAIEHSRAVQSESDILINGIGQGMNTAFREHVHFTRLRPGRFRSDVSVVTLSTKSGAAYQIISDGKQVWTFNPAAREYAVTPLTEYTKSYNLGHHVAGLGLFGALVAGSGAAQDDTLQDLTVLLATQPGASGGTETVDGRPLHVLALDTGGRVRFRFLLDPLNARIQQLEFAGQEPQVAFSMTEKMTHQSLVPKLEAKMFQFTPPPGARRVATIRIGFLP